MARESQLVLGVDPDPDALWPRAQARAQEGGPLDVRLGAAFTEQGRALIDATAPACVGVKLQLACFERLGAAGWDALRTLTDHARQAGLLVIADGKRGDIPVSAAAYADALLGDTESAWGTAPGLGVDAATVNPLMGTDALVPFVDAARAGGRGLFVLVRTSNPGAADIQELELAGGGRVWERLATLVDQLGEGEVGEHGLSSVGAVVGATAPEHLIRLRELMPHAVFLLPGVGAQGGSVGELAPAFGPGRAGALITASRAIAQAHLARGGAPEAAARAQAEQLRAQAWDLPV